MCNENECHVETVEILSFLGMKLNDEQLKSIQSNHPEIQLVMVDSKSNLVLESTVGPKEEVEKFYMSIDKHLQVRSLEDEYSHHDGVSVDYDDDETVPEGIMISSSNRMISYPNPRVSYDIINPLWDEDEKINFVGYGLSHVLHDLNVPVNTYREKLAKSISKLIHNDESRYEEYLDQIKFYQDFQLIRMS